MSAKRGVTAGEVLDAGSRSARLLRDVYSQVREAPQIAERHGMTLRELAAWAGAEESRTTVEGLCRFEDARAELLLRRARVKAARRLLRLSGEASSEETRRKACVDLLRLGGASAARRASEEEDVEGAMELLQEGPEAEAIRELLERGGARSA